MSHADMMVNQAERLSSSVDAVASIPKPVVAAVTGYALGGGCELALTADVRFSADNARWGQPEILLGMIPGAGGTQRLPRLIGPSRAKELIYSGRMVGADEALRIGLVDRVHPRADVYDAALAWAAPVRRRVPRWRCARPRRPSTAVWTATSTAACAWSRTCSPALFATEDSTIGMTSFIDNGPGKADFVGR